MESHEWTEEKSEKTTTPNYSKEYVTKPAFLDAAGDVDGKDVLEIGCGEGYWLRLLHDQGANCTGIDRAASQIEKARENTCEDITFIHGDAASQRLDGFDLVFLQNVLLEIEHLEQIHDVLRTASAALHDEGRLIINDLHPCVAHFEYDNLEQGEDYAYFRSGSTVKIVSKRVNDDDVVYVDYHWTLEDLVSAITGAGFTITTIKEPKPSQDVLDETPYLAYREHTPYNILFEARV